MSDVLEDVTAAVDALKGALPDLLAACTDPRGLDVAELLFHVQTARLALLDLERQVEDEAAHALTEDMVTTDRLRIERRRARDRKQWDHETWKRDVRNQVIRTAGLKGATVVNADGEPLEAGALHELLARVQEVAGSGPPKTTALRALGLDPMDYCETSAGSTRVLVQVMADTEGDDDAEA